MGGPAVPAAEDFDSDSAPLVPLAMPEPDERREAVLDALRITRTFDLIENGGREIVPVSAWLTPGEIPRYEARADTPEFRVRGRAASADAEGNLVFREEGRFSVEIIVRGPDESENFRQVMTGFRNHFDGVRQARITCRVLRDGSWEALASVVRVKTITGPDRVIRHNAFPAADINGNAAPGASSGQAQALMEELAREVLPAGFSFEWTALAYQQKLTGQSGVWVFGLCVIFAYLILAAHPIENNRRNRDRGAQ
jgi:hypothetical protein